MKNMSTFQIVIPFTPKPKASVRLGKHGAYNPVSKGMSQVAGYVRDRLTLEAPLTKPLVVVLHFVLPSPLSLPLKTRQSQHSQPCSQKPDIDNLVKYVADALTGIVWKDDAQIVWLLASKSKTVKKTGHTFLHVIELEGDQPDYQLILSTIKNNIYLDKGVPYAI